MDVDTCCVRKIIGDVLSGGHTGHQRIVTHRGRKNSPFHIRRFAALLNHFSNWVRDFRFRAAHICFPLPDRQDERVGLRRICRVRGCLALNHRRKRLDDVITRLIISAARQCLI